MHSRACRPLTVQPCGSARRHRRMSAPRRRARLTALELPAEDSGTELGHNRSSARGSLSVRSRTSSWRLLPGGPAGSRAGRGRGPGAPLRARPSDLRGHRGEAGCPGTRTRDEARPADTLRFGGRGHLPGRRRADGRRHAARRGVERLRLAGQALRLLVHIVRKDAGGTGVRQRIFSHYRVRPHWLRLVD